MITRRKNCIIEYMVKTKFVLVVIVILLQEVVQ